MTDVQKLKSICELKKGKKVNSTKKKTETSVPYLLIDTLRGAEPEFFTEDKKYTEAIPSDILIVGDGANSGLVGTDLKGAVGSTIIRLRIKKDVADKDYISYFLLSKFGILNKNIKGAAIPHLKSKEMLEMNISIPSIEEQQLIVDEIEKHLSRLDETVENLKNVKKNLGIYRKSVLKAAFEDDEDNSTLIGEICNLINGRAFKPKEWSSEGLPIIRIQNLNNPRTSFNYCNFKIEDKYYVNSGDLLFAWSGTPGTSFGAHMWSGPKAVLNQHIFRVEIDETKIDKAFFMYLINKNLAEYIFKAHGTAGLAHITKNKFESSKVFIPPLEKQQEIVQDIKSRFSVIDKLEETVNTSLSKAERLRSSILKSAFEGKLVKFKGDEK